MNNIENEIWKDIEGYEGLYQVSNLGRVRSLDKTVKNAGSPSGYIKLKGIIRKSKPDKDGYWTIDLSKEGKKKTFKLHRLVALAFIPNPDSLPEVNHKNEVKTDNSVSNLEWCSSQYNSNYGTRSIRSGENRRKKVNQYDLNGNLIKSFRSIKEASEETGINERLISSCSCGNQRTTEGYIFKSA